MLLRKELIGAAADGGARRSRASAPSSWCSRVDGARARAAAVPLRRAARSWSSSATAARRSAPSDRRKRHVAELPPPRDAVDGEPALSAGDPSAAIAAHYADVAGDGGARARPRRSGRARRQEARAARSPRSTSDRERARAAVDKRKWGDLLLAHLGEVPRGASSVTLPDDFADGAPLDDPARSGALGARQRGAPVQGAQAAVARARRHREAPRATRARAARRRLARGDFVPRGAGADSPAAKKRARDERPPPYREFRSSTGAAILVGRGADRNDELTFKVARGNDLWLHTRDVPGAHVVVPLERPARRRRDAARRGDAGRAPLERARRAAGRRRSTSLRKHVRKPPKSAPGHRHALGRQDHARAPRAGAAGAATRVARRRGPVATRPARARDGARCAIVDDARRSHRAAPASAPAGSDAVDRRGKAERRGDARRSVATMIASASTRALRAGAATVPTSRARRRRHRCARRRTRNRRRRVARPVRGRARPRRRRGPEPPAHLPDSLRADVDDLSAAHCRTPKTAKAAPKEPPLPSLAAR